MSSFHDDQSDQAGRNENAAPTPEQIEWGRRYGDHGHAPSYDTMMARFIIKDLTEHGYVMPTHEHDWVHVDVRNNWWTEEPEDVYACNCGARDVRRVIS